MTEQSGAKIYRDNLALALSVAIKSRTKWEQDQGYTGASALLMGWREALEALEKNKPLEIIE